MREQLAARQLTEGAIPDQVLSATDVDVENSSHSILGLAASAGNNHVGKSNVNNCTTSVRGNATSQPSVNSISGPATVNVTADVFANNSSVDELTLPSFYDSLKHILLQFLRDLD